MDNCVFCGARVLSTGVCSNPMCTGGYIMDDSIEAFINNNLWVVDKSVGKLNLEHKPDLYILGGAAMCLHELDYKYTVDIDTANKLHKAVKDVSDGLVDDAASEVVTTARYYKDRAIHIMKYLVFINVYILGIEDLLITKVLAGRLKDITSIKSSGMLDRIDKKLLLNIASTELEDRDCKEVVSFIRHCEELNIL